MARAVNEAGLELIKSFENFSVTPYQDQGGVWTIGYGHTAGVEADTPPVTEEEAEDLLQDDLDAACCSVERLVRVPLSDNQYAALVSLTYNCGTKPLLGGLGKVLNAADYSACSMHFSYWNEVTEGGKRVVSAGLTRRRAAERQLFLKPDGNSAPNNID